MLTPDDILRLPAGRDLDAVVAEMRGWECWHKQNGFCDGKRLTKCMVCGCRGHGHCYGSGSGAAQVPCCRDMPGYSTDWQHAYPLLEEMRQKRAYIQLTVWWGDHYSVSCDQIPGGTGAVISGKDGPEAIAKAWCLWRLGQQEGATG